MIAPIAKTQLVLSTSTMDLLMGYAALGVNVVHAGRIPPELRAGVLALSADILTDAVQRSPLAAQEAVTAVARFLTRSMESSHA